MPIYRLGGMVYTSHMHVASLNCDAWVLSPYSGVGGGGGGGGGKGPVPYRELRQ